MQTLMRCPLQVYSFILGYENNYGIQSMEYILPFFSFSTAYQRGNNGLYSENLALGKMPN